MHHPGGTIGTSQLEPASSLQRSLTYDVYL